MSYSPHSLEDKLYKDFKKLSSVSKNLKNSPTPLPYLNYQMSEAVISGDLNTVEALLKLGVNPNLNYAKGLLEKNKKPEFKTALELAAESGSLKMVKLLDKYQAKPSVLQSEPFFSYCLKSNNPELLDWALENDYEPIPKNRDELNKIYTSLYNENGQVNSTAKSILWWIKKDFPITQYPENISHFSNYYNIPHWVSVIASAAIEEESGELAIWFDQFIGDKCQKITQGKHWSKVNIENLSDIVNHSWTQAFQNNDLKTIAKFFQLNWHPSLEPSTYAQQNILGQVLSKIKGTFSLTYPEALNVLLDSKELIEDLVQHPGWSEILIPSDSKDSLNFELLDHLIKHKINIFELDNDGETLFHKKYVQVNEELIQWLYSHKRLDVLTTPNKEGYPRIMGPQKEQLEEIQLKIAIPTTLNTKNKARL